jgi:hypothetical protein
MSFVHAANAALEVYKYVSSSFAADGAGLATRDQVVESRKVTNRMSFAA